MRNSSRRCRQLRGGGGSGTRSVLCIAILMLAVARLTAAIRRWIRSASLSVLLASCFGSWARWATSSANLSASELHM